MQNKDFSFKKEIGGLLSATHDLLYVVEGAPTSVDILPKTTWRFHKENRGIIYGFAHVHPPDMHGLSHEDETTLRAWAAALSPYPMRFVVISETDPTSHYKKEGDLDSRLWIRTSYFGNLESLEMWDKKREQDVPKTLKIKPRSFEVIKEGSKTDNFYNLPFWARVLVKLSQRT